MHDQDLTQGVIGRQLWKLAWPMMLSVFFYTLYNLVDAYWVSKISPEAIAAVSISQISLFIMISLGFGITVGSGVIMAMHIGAKNKGEAERVLGQSFVLSAMMAVVFTVIALAYREDMLILSGASGSIFEPALEYYTIVASGSLLLFIMMAVMFAFNSQGDTTTLTKLFALSTGINIVLDPLFIFGLKGVFPALGISGAAIATLLSQAIFLVIAIRTLMNPKRQIGFRFYNLTFRLESVKKVLDIGFPAALTQIIFPIGLAALTKVISLSFFEPGAIAFNLGFRVEFFAYLPAVGFGFAAMAMMGQNLGARNLDRAKQSFSKAMKYAVGGAAGMGIIAAIFATPFIRIFTDDPVVTDYTRSYMWTVAFSYGFLAALLVEANAFQAINHAWAGFWMFLLRLVIIAVPLSYVLTYVFDFSIYGIWIGVIAGNVISSIVGYILIRRSLSRIDVEAMTVFHEGESSPDDAQVETLVPDTAQ